MDSQEALAVWTVGRSGRALFFGFLLLQEKVEYVVMRTIPSCRCDGDFPSPQSRPPV